MSLTDVQLHLVESPEEVDAFRSWLGERRPVLALDLETSGLSLAHDHIRLAQFGDGEQGWAIPYEDWRGLVRYTLAEYEGPLVLHHAKFDAGFLLKDGLTFPWARTHDTMLMCFLTNSLGPKSLKGAAKLYVDPAARAGEQALRQAMSRNRWTWGNIPLNLDLYWGYGALDTVLTARLAEDRWKHVQPFRGAYDLEMACERVLCEMELRGMRIDVEYCEDSIESLTRREVELEGYLDGVNPNAPLQIAAALQRDGALLTKRTEKGQLSVDDSVLTKLASDYPVAGWVLEARHIRKMVSGYFENFLSYRDADLLHPHINQLAARTGRMSVTEPALQTVPREALIRDSFVAREGNSLLLVDYDNQELRVAAHFSNDAGMLAAFEEGRDLHAETARTVFGEGFTKEQRGIGKAAMYTKTYGGGVPKFAITTGLPEHEALRVFRGIDRAFPGLATTMATVTRLIRERSDGEFGYIELIDGRHLLVPADKPYVGFNFLMQGSCAVVLKQGIVDLDLAGFGEYLVLPVHDELILDVPKDLLTEVTPEVTRILTREDFRAPLTVGHKIVDRWGDAYREE